MVSACERNDMYSVLGRDAEGQNKNAMTSRRRWIMEFLKRLRTLGKVIFWQIALRGCGIKSLDWGFFRVTYNIREQFCPPCEEWPELFASGEDFDSFTFFLFSFSFYLLHSV